MSACTLVACKLAVFDFCACAAVRYTRCSNERKLQYSFISGFGVSGVGKAVRYLCSHHQVFQNT